MKRKDKFIENFMATGQPESVGLLCDSVTDIYCNIPSIKLSLFKIDCSVFNATIIW